ncbi:hypothetical protein NLC25_003547 [Salmonella enterica]|nr:hypothetical protein [Salmonella enterica]
MENVGGIYYEIQAKTGDLLKADKEVVKFTEKVEESFNKADSAVSDFSETAKRTSAALKMPEVNKLSAQLAQLSGKIGAASDAANDGAVANTKFSGALSTVAGKLGAGYVTNVGSATSSLIKHAKAALDATSAQVDNARAAQQEATALQGAASALALKAAEEKTLAESAAKTAAAELTAAEAIFERKTADIASLEALLTRQKESLRQAEANLTVTNSEKAVAAAVKARSAVDATSAKIQKQSNQAVKEVVAAEDKAKAAKEAVTAANQKLTAAIKIEAAALATVAKANDAATIAAERHTLATKAQAVAVSGARSALNLLGGPSGILLLAAAGVYSLYQAMSDNQDIEQFKRDIDEAANKLQYLTETQAKAAAAKTVIAIKADTKDLDKTSEKISVVNAQIRYMEENPFEWMEANPFGNYDKTLESLRSKLVLLEGEHEKLNDTIKRNNSVLDAFSQQAERAGDVSSEAATANEIYDNSVKGLTTSNSLLEKAINGSLSAAEEWAATSQLEKAMSDAGVSAEEAAVQVAKLHDEFERKRSLTFEQMLKQTEQNVNALKIEMQEGAEAAAVYRAQLQAGEMGMTDQGEIDKLIAATRERVRLQKQLSDSKKGGRSSSNTKANADTATQALLRQQAALDRLNTGYADGSLELAKYDAVVALGNKASAEQIAKAEQQAESIWKIQQATKAAAEEERKRKQSQQNFTNLQGQASPVAAVDNAFAQQKAQLDEYVQLYPQKIAEAEAVRAGIEDQYHQKRMAAMWEEWQQQSEINSMLGAAVDSLQGGATNAITGLINGTQSLQESLANIGTTILNSVVGSFVQMGVEWVKSQLMGQAAAAASLASTMAQATAAASAWAPAAMSASIATYGSAAAVGQAAYAESLLAAKGMALAGGRRYGGTVSAGNAYRINENGRSEIFQTAGGQQAFIPNQSGKIIPADKAGGGGGVVQHITFEINTTGGIDDATMAKMAQMMKQVSLNTIRDQQRPNGLLRR